MLDTNTVLHRKKIIFDRWAPNYDHLLTTVIYQAIHKRLLDSVELPVSAVVLDLGCGTGRFLDRLATNFPEIQGIGLDLSEVMVQHAQTRNRWGDRLQFQRGEASQLPFSDRTLDAVFSTFSFMHYPEPHRVLREIVRVLQPGGSFYWVDPTSESGPIGWWMRQNQIHLYSRPEREELGAAVGLQYKKHVDLLRPALLTVFQSYSLLIAP